MGRDGLVEPFLNALPEKHGVDPSDLEDRLEALVGAAAREMPELLFDRSQFVAHVARRLAPDQGRNATLAKVRAGDLLLSFACLACEPRALSKLDNLVRRIAASNWVVRGLARGEREDVGQQVLETLLTRTKTRGPALEQYCGRGPLRAWLAVVCARQARVTHERQQRELASRRVGGVFAVDCDAGIGDDPELEMMQTQSAQALEVALTAALRGLARRDHLVLQYWYVDRVSITEIGGRILVHRNTAARVLERANQRLLKKTRLHLGAKASIGPERPGCRMSYAERLSSVLLGALDTRPRV